MQIVLFIEFEVSAIFPLQDRAKPYNHDSKGRKVEEPEQNVPLKRTMSDLTPFSGKHSEYLDICSSHNSGYKKRLDPAFENPLSLGFQPLADFE